MYNLGMNDVLNYVDELIIYHRAFQITNAIEFNAVRQGTLIEGKKLYGGCSEFMSCRNYVK
jgi:hypothetical protein